ncbi:heat shock factor protein isoform X3 [Cephus cinctus]|uniref:Heat shock factor protein isoform X3 n=1 Tax=Cephus cinctus TaxID=211228 RepID=A0AAJ7RE06_CEPCN|nr:heat shock factor protein isoform X3 [Cephus cinctus]
MHTITELGTSVPAFLGKLWKLVEDPETDDLICWAPNGRSFFIRNQAQFARELLPHYYKHNNMASFVRQLNMYGFHKKVSVELGGLKCDRDEMEFAHQYFCKDHPYLLDHIKRKIASNKGQDPTHAPMKPELMNKMLTEVRTMRGRQEHLDSRLGAMKRENEALWRELAMLRQKHLKQQQIVNKLIHFLVTLVQPSRGGGLSVKRRYPLMIDDSNRQRNKQAKLSKPQTSPTGPVIHELDASEPDLDSEYIVAEMLENHESPAVESPEHNGSLVMDDGTLETLHLVNNAVQLPEGIQLIAPEELESTTKKRAPKGKKKSSRLARASPDFREETFMLQVPYEDSSVDNVELLEHKVAKSKPVPLATMRSSKLAAMAANMNKANEFELDLDLESAAADADADAEEDPKDIDQPGLVKLEDILIIPDNVQEANDDRDTQGIIDEGQKINDAQRDDSDGGDNYVDFENGSFGNLNGIIEGLTSEKSPKSNGASTSTSPKDLSLSCVNPSGMTDAVYRLGPMEEVDTHLESMQTELDNLREILRGEGYSIDANTLLGLFGADDPMSFGIPMNPELDPHSNREKDEEDQTNDSTGGSTGRGELMPYNPVPSLLDFDDDIFMNATTSSPGTGAGSNTDVDFATDPLDLEDSKASLLDSLVAGNDVNRTS